MLCSTIPLPHYPVIQNLVSSSISIEIAIESIVKLVNWQQDQAVPYFLVSLPKLSQKSRSIDGSRFLGLFRKGKTHILAKFHRSDLVICGHSREGKTTSYSQINTVTGMSIISENSWSIE